MNKIKKAYNWFYSRNTIAAFLFLLIGASIVFADKNFLNANNMVNILNKAAKNGGMLALGMTFVILIGEIDLSVGAIYALSGVVMGLVGQVNPILGIIAGLMVGVIAGALIGFMNTKMRISSWIASLAMSFAGRGLILILAKKSVPIKDPMLRFGGVKFFKGAIEAVPAGISILIPILIILTFVCMYVSRYSKFGMSLYAVGGNADAAKMMGIPVTKVKMKAFICCSVIAAFSGMLQASSSGSATLSAGNVYETYAIAMCAIGAVKLTGGEGKFSGTFFGIMIYFIINTIFTYLPSSITVHWQSIIMGILVLVSVSMQSELIQNIKIGKKKAEL